MANFRYFMIQHIYFFIIFASSNDIEDAFSNKNILNSSAVIELDNP